MNEIARRSSCAVLLALAATAPAAADTTSDLQFRLDGALKAARSFVVTTVYPAQAYSSTLVVVAPDRSRVAVAVEAATTEVVTIGRTTYSSKNGAPFQRATLPDAGARAPSAGSVKVTAMHADVMADGVTYGAFETTVPMGKLVTLTCLYDKKSFRLARCANQEVTATYTDYDGTQNVVDAPKNAVDAPTVDVHKDVQ